MSYPPPQQPPPQPQAPQPQPGTGAPAPVPAPASTSGGGGFSLGALGTALIILGVAVILVTWLFVLYQSVRTDSSFLEFQNDENIVDRFVAFMLTTGSFSLSGGATLILAGVLAKAGHMIAERD